jgi:hypothetical protein
MLIAMQKTRMETPHSNWQKDRAHIPVRKSWKSKNKTDPSANFIMLR